MSKTQTQSTETRMPPQLPPSFRYEPPQRKSEYVGYDRRVFRQGNPETGQAADIRSSVWVREYPSVKIANVQRKSKQANGETFEYGSVTFDPTSVVVGKQGQTLQHEFGAQVAPGPALDALEYAHRQGMPVAVIIETQRRAKTKSGRKIGPLESILALRGGTPENDWKSNANSTGENCANVLVGVAPANDPSQLILTYECRSEPTEWESLRRNQKHDLPPNGWKVLDGGITRVDGASGGDLDVDAIAQAVAARLGSNPAKATGPSRSATPTQTRRGRVVEEPPYKLVNSDGSLNVGSFAISKDRAVLGDAVAILTAKGINPADDLAAFMARAQQIKGVLLWMADQVQVRVTGMNAPDRVENSSKEAGLWVKFVYETLPGYEPVIDGSDAVAWAKSTVEAAINLYGHAIQDLCRNLGMNPAQASPLFVQRHEGAQGEQQGQSQPQNGQQGQSGQSQPQNGQQGQSGTVKDHRDLADRYGRLLETVNLLNDPTCCQPLLMELFGAHMIGDIPADKFAAQLATWEADPAQFRQDAEIAYNAVN